MIDVTALRALQSVATLGTLTRAAEELGFTASAISQQIKRLEQQLGVAVLVPAGRGVLLTPAGRAVVASAPDIFAAIERCTEAARSVADGAPRGTLRVAAFSTAIHGLLAPALPGLATRCPQLRLEITEANPDGALREVNSGAVDLALVHDADGVPAPAPSTVRQRAVHIDVGTWCAVEITR
jgi:DNA-binding transcriptional LysR family regulator